MHSGSFGHSGERSHYQIGSWRDRQNISLFFNTPWFERFAKSDSLSRFHGDVRQHLSEHFIMGPLPLQRRFETCASSDFQIELLRRAKVEFLRSFPIILHRKSYFDGIRWAIFRFIRADFEHKSRRHWRDRDTQRVSI